MNNELFDRMIKDNLQEMQVAPSAGVKKMLGWKLFFQNLIVFHKVKVAVGLLLVSGASTYYFVSETSEDGSQLNGQYISALVDETNEDEVTNDVEFIVDEQIENDGVSKSENQVVTNDQDISYASNDVEDAVGIEKENSDMNFTADDSPADKDEAGSDMQDDLDGDNEGSDAGLATVSDGSETPKDVDVNLTHDEHKTNDAVATEEAYAALFKGENRPLKLESVSNLTEPQTGPMPSMGNPTDWFGELSFDIYKGVMGQSQINSKMASAIHDKYYWDFHGSNDALDMNVLGGVNINYTFGARVFRLKASAGVSYYTLSDSKAVYEFEEITSPVWLSFFNTDELAWVNTYGEDTCTQCFYAHNTEELQNELKEDYNKYSYLRIPLKLGTQFNFKYVSVDLMGGLDMNFLTNSIGLFVKEGLNPNYERFYFWDDLQLSTLSEGNEMLKKSFATWSLAASLRVRVCRQFDVLAGYQINQSMGSITNDDYIMDKTLKTSNMTVGLTFYPNRAKLKPQF